MEYKEKTKETYDNYAREYEEIKDENFVENYLKEDFEYFCKNLNGKEVLDLGSGPGNDSLKMKEQRLNPTCIDISQSMVKICKEKGLKSQQMDFENLDFKENSFDGVWSRTSLLHMPKEKLPETLKQIREILKPEGLFYITMKEGNFEGFKQNSEFEGNERYFSLYQKEEIENILSRFFEIIKSSKTKMDENHAYLNFRCKN
ncbi:MAG: class I SAM-dependent methyltransferase [Candidatus Pacearchaeota archaeon]